MDNEILNLEYHRKQLLIKALNKSKTIQMAAYYLEVSERTVHRWIHIYKISKDPKTKQHFFRSDRNPVVVLK